MKTQWAQRTLQVGIALEFLGHGLLALDQHAPWVPFITLFGFSEASVLWIMPVVGALDILLAGLVLVYPARGILVWMTFWGFFTALLRPLSGGSIIQFIERGVNWGAPAALLFLRGRARARNNT